ncbi:MAG: DUF3570 domain-containing protein [Labilithrix sp.]|nr:DUF3570 domain-containing protein [Labilithrix sp.]MCW5810244.1 DUF3570 domain-containing protein [Labilithrix sp.]
MLRRFVVFATLLVLAAVAGPAHADGTSARIATEVAGYTDTVGVSVFTPSVSGVVENPLAGWAASGRYLVDVVSAASPDIVSTASPRWTEVRNAGSIGARYKPSWWGVGIGASTSYTPDYLALGANVQLTQELDDKHITLVEGYSFGRDTIGRAGTSFDTFSYDLTTHGTTLGASRIINESTVIGIYADGIFERGNQSKPYRYIPMFAPEIAPIIPRGATAFSVADARITAKPIENLPRGRDRFAVTGRLGWRTDRTTVRLDQRLYGDNWSLLASTTDFRWFVDVAERITVWPHLRVHVQSGVDFWRRAYSATSLADIPLFRTGDRELGPLSNFGAGGGVRFALGRSGAKEDFVLGFSADGTWTSFTDAIYVKNRFSGLAATTVEVGF